MSKAFTRESDQPESEPLPSFRPQLPSGAKNYITQEGLTLLRTQLEQALERRRQIGDSGNDSGPGVVAEQRRLEATIRRFQSILSTVVVAEIPPDREKVAFGALVLVRHGNGEEGRYQIVGVDESDPDQGRISWISPLARALVNCRAGDQVRFQSPAGKDDLLILHVAYDGAAKA